MVDISTPCKAIGGGARGRTGRRGKPGDDEPLPVEPVEEEMPLEPVKRVRVRGDSEDEVVVAV